MAKYRITDLTLNDKICLCAVAVLGRSITEAAFLLAHPTKTTNKKSLGVMVSRWVKDEQAQEFLNNIRSGNAKVIAPDAANDLTTREGIINQLVTATQQTSGKDSLSGLQTLAKIQGFDRPSEEPEGEERRSYFLPWVSVCKSCKLMQIFRDLDVEEDK
jgi:hypothetical protein